MRKLVFWFSLLNLCLLVLFVRIPLLSAQSGTPIHFVAHPNIPIAMAQVQSATVYTYTGQLTGEWPIQVGGQSYTIASRNTIAGAAGLEKATQFVYEHMQALGLTVSYQPWSNCEGEDPALANRNVIGEKIGTTLPDEIVVMIAHVDSMPESATNSYGADDDASGTAAVLVAADILSQSQFKFQRTIRLIISTGEEQNMCGARTSAVAARSANEKIVAVYNVDMLGYTETPNHPVVQLHTRTMTDTANYASDLAIAGVFTNVVSLYMPNALVPRIAADAVADCDAAVYWPQNYPAILAIEDDVNYTNPNMHTVNDRLSTLNLSYLTNYVKAAIGTMADLALPYGVMTYLPLIQR